MSVPLRSTLMTQLYVEYMRRLSSNSTFWYKRLFPVFWFGFIAIWTALACIAMAREGKFQIMFIIMPLIMAGFGFVVMKMLVFDLVDSVWDADCELVIRNKGKEDRIPIGNIINVGHSTFTNLPRITLTVKGSSVFGEEITFSPPTSWKFWTTHPIAKDLIQRIDEERRKC